VKITDPGVLDFHHRVLELPTPWLVSSVDLGMKDKSVLIEVTYPPGTLVHCPECGKLCSVKDKRKKRWRHLSLMQLQTFVECDVPRADCEQHGIHQILVPWAEPNGRFTLAFEDFGIQLIQASSNLTAAAALLGISWDGVQSIQRRGVERGKLRQKEEAIAFLGVDEKSFLSRHRYATVLSDLKASKVVEVVQGRDEEATRQAFAALGPEQKKQVKAVAMDMWEPYRKIVSEQLENAVVVHDRYHVSTYLNKAVDMVRKKEHRERKVEGDECLTGTKYLWLTHPKNWTDIQKVQYRQLKVNALKVGRAFAIKENFRVFWSYFNRKSAEDFHKRWHYWATHSRLKPMIEAARTIQRHLKNICNYFRYRISNAAAEGLNSKIQIIKSAARGFRNFENFRTAILFHCGGLKMRPHESR
jgi:transposase